MSGAAQPKSLADLLGVSADDAAPSLTDAVDVTDVESFGKLLVNSREFRTYLIDGLKFGNLPGFTQVLCRVLDKVWGAPSSQQAQTVVVYVPDNSRDVQQRDNVRRFFVAADRRPVAQFDDEQDVHVELVDNGRDGPDRIN